MNSQTLPLEVPPVEQPCEHGAIDQILMPMVRIVRVYQDARHIERMACYYRSLDQAALDEVVVPRSDLGLKLVQLYRD